MYTLKANWVENAYAWERLSYVAQIRLLIRAVKSNLYKNKTSEWNGATVNM